VKKEYEDQYHRLEEKHWWFQGRRHLVRGLVLQAHPDRAGRILELGCAGGPLIHQLHADGYPHVTGIDISAEAIAVCRQRGLTDTHVMDAQKLAFPDESFDVLTASDVLEHLADAPRAVCEWRRVLKPEGVLIVFVPAFQFQWSEHDRINQHFKRYRRPELRRLLADNGFQVVRSSYWNFLLFWPVALIRLIRRLRPKDEAFAGDIRPAPALLNRALTRLLRCENALLLRGLNFPVGVSVMAVGRKTR
jgi:2-polyprenyl-3-methyl-5-hydroxy-6-metoxy-1,4-benzoquinol methylase